jgi:hypothetical protein
VSSTTQGRDAVDDDLADGATTGHHGADRTALCQATERWNRDEVVRTPVSDRHLGASVRQRAGMRNGRDVRRHLCAMDDFLGGQHRGSGVTDRPRALRDAVLPAWAFPLNAPALGVVAGSGPWTVDADAVDHAGRLDDRAVEAVLVHLDRRLGDRWDVPWQLYGVRGADVAAHPASDLVRIDPLVTRPVGHPAEALWGRTAPTGVAGLVLVTEGFSNDEGRLDSDGEELRVLYGVLADNRIFMRVNSRRRGVLAEFGGAGFDGVVADTVCRVLGVEVAGRAEFDVVASKVLAALARRIGSGGGALWRVARSDPLTAAAFELAGEAALVRSGPGGDASIDPQRTALGGGFEAAVEAGGSDWLTSEVVAAVATGPFGRAALAAFATRVLGHPAELSSWWGPTCLIEQLDGRLDPTEDSLAATQRSDPVLAGRVRAVIEHRRKVWSSQSG